MFTHLALGLLTLSSGAQKLDDVALTTLAGEEVRLGSYLGNGPVVLAYTGVGCPISGKYAGRLQRMSESYGERGVTFLGVNASSQDSREEIAAECAELGIEFEVLKDFRQELTRRLGAKTTTETFVITGGEVRYRGPVDDQYSLGAAKPAPTENHLADALEAVLAGKRPETTELDAPGCKLALLAEDDLTEAVTWSRDIAPLLQQNCQTCHRPGQVGPFALETYEQARGWADMMYEVVEQERMPPWNASDVFDGVFANERGLSEEEKEKLFRWVEDGMPRGNPADDPRPVDWPEGWTIGEPDAVFQFEKRMYDGRPVADPGFEVPREGVVDYQYFTVETDYPEDRWVRALEVRPGAADVVHHVLIMLQAAPDDDLDFRSYLAVAVPGDTPSVYPAGYGKLLPAGATLVFQLHYTPNGKQRFDRSSLAMIFCDEPPEYEVVTRAVVNQRFSIPPGAENHEVQGWAEIDRDTNLVALFPHMHTRGKDFQYVARYPDGRREELLYSYYDFNWQESYLWRDPKPVPAGTRIECVGHFDNSDKNPNNPDPAATVEWGEQTFDEMFIGYYDVVRRAE